MGQQLAESLVAASANAGTLQTLKFPRPEYLPAKGLATLFNSTKYLSRSELGAFTALMKPVRQVGKRTQLASSGEHAHSVYILTEGWACSARFTKDGGKSIAALFLPGDVIGTGALHSQNSFEDVCTLTSARVISLPLAKLRLTVREMPGLANLFCALAAAETARMGAWIKCLARFPAPRRFAHLFCELAVRLQAWDAAGEVEFPLPLTQAELGDVTGLTTVHVNRVLTALRREGLVHLSEGRIIIRDCAALGELAEFNPSYLEAGGMFQNGRTGFAGPPRLASI